MIGKALGNAALRIEHIGSTSVPGLAAKPIVDILLVVENSGDETSYLPRLEEAGYELRVREPDFHEHRMLRTPTRDVHVHVYSPSSPEIERCLVFATGFAATRMIAGSTRTQSGNWRGNRGRTWTPTQGKNCSRRTHHRRSAAAG